MVSNNTTLLSAFVDSLIHTNTTKKALKYKFNARLQSSYANLSNFAKDKLPNATDETL